MVGELEFVRHGVQWGWFVLNLQSSNPLCERWLVVTPSDMDHKYGKVKKGLVDLEL